MPLTVDQITRVLSRKLLGKKHTGIMMDYYREKLPQIEYPKTSSEWDRRTEKIRKDLLAKVFLRGHEKGILDAPPKVEWRGVIETGKGYRIRKLRYEGYPGMWIPALLYEPVGIRGKVPAVLNVNGHHRGGKAMPYKQARCINLAKRGMLALNTEFVGMGELQGSAFHMQQGHVDLCGVAGVGVMYLAMKRGLDVLLAHKQADLERVAMTGLSGGGWQTAVLSAIDERIGAILPVSGHSPIWHRATVRWEDHGDLEQTPVDLCTVADYDTLTAMFAPRPSLLIHSVNDGIFRPEFMRPAIYRPAKKVYKFLGVEDRIGFYANEDPGTHNYDKDIREQLYGFLNTVWNLDT
ncbi:MAG: acetylxylan esterase, partial [bacterium]|nr:acetylxylan esterase [bacterium]